MAPRLRDRNTGNWTLTQRRLRYKAVLEPLGLCESFKAMPRRLQELICQHKYPDPVLEFDETFPADAPHRRLRKHLEQSFRKASLPPELEGIAVRDFFGVICGLHAVVTGTLGKPDFPETGDRFMRRAKPLLDVWCEHYQRAAFDALHRAVISPLVAHSCMDSRMLCAHTSVDPTANGKQVVRMSIGAAEPQVRRVRLDGAVRPMYRVGSANEWHGAAWLSWGEEQLSCLGGIRPQSEQSPGLPVYIQSHALRQLRARVDLPRMAPYLECWLYESLKQPRAKAWMDDERRERLVEYRIREDRLGYLVVSVLPNLVAVRTFLFVTMDGTPESVLLRRKLRLSRRDINWVGLHQLSAFTQTDLRDDPVLRPLLQECGCGDLFELETADYAPVPKPLAREIKKYLRLAA